MHSPFLPFNPPCDLDGRHGWLTERLRIVREYLAELLWRLTLLR